MAHITAADMKVKLLSGVLVSGLFGAGVVPDAYAGAIALGLHCGPAYEFYGKGGYTYTEVRGCVESRAEGTRVRVNTFNTQYWARPLVWHSAGYGGTAGAMWSAAGTIRQGAWQGDFTTPVRTQNASTDTAEAREGMNLQCGTLAMELKLIMAGPYWLDPKYDIDPDRRTFEMRLPCRDS